MTAAWDDLPRNSQSELAEAETDEPAANWHRREAEVFAQKIADYVPAEEMGVLIHALETISAGFLVTALREIAA